MSVNMCLKVKREKKNRYKIVAENMKVNRKEQIKTNNKATRPISSWATHSPKGNMYILLNNKKRGFVSTF